MLALGLKYQRPTSLSDPFDDFTEDMLAEILKTPDEKMRKLFCPARCIRISGIY